MLVDNDNKEMKSYEMMKQILRIISGETAILDRVVLWLVDWVFDSIHLSQLTRSFIQQSTNSAKLRQTPYNSTLYSLEEYYCTYILYILYILLHTLGCLFQTIFFSSTQNVSIRTDNWSRS
jgi:hypothetical protein